MSRRGRTRRYAVPGVADEMKQFKADVMSRAGYQVDRNHPDDVKFEAAREVGVPLRVGYNGDLRAEDAGKVGGQIGGRMVKEMIRIAQEQLKNQPRS